MYLYRTSATIFFCLVPVLLYSQGRDKHLSDSVRTSIHLALSHIQKKDTAFNGLLFPILFYLFEKYETVLNIPPKTMLKKTEYSPLEESEKKLLSVIIKKKNVTRKNIKKMNEYHKIFTYSLYKPKSISGDQFINLISKYSTAEDIPTVYHMALWLRIAIQNDYVHPDDSVLKLIAYQNSRILDFIKHYEPQTDPWIEAVALYQFNSDAPVLHDDWIRLIVACQQPDGSWTPGKSFSSSSDHTTLLALWALWAYSQPTARILPWNYKLRRKVVRLAKK
jgi:hypothetical protein